MDCLTLLMSQAKREGELLSRDLQQLPRVSHRHWGVHSLHLLGITESRRLVTDISLLGSPDLKQEMTAIRG